MDQQQVAPHCLDQTFRVQTFLSNLIRFLSPRAYISISKFACSGPFGVKGVDDALFQWLTVLPIFIILFRNSCDIRKDPQISSSTSAYHHDIFPIDSTRKGKHELITSCLLPNIMRAISLTSPLIIGLIQDTAPTLISFFKRCFTFITLRTAPLPSVQKLISSLMNNGRMQKYPRYDIYFPPHPSQEEVNSATDVLILIPGLLVPHEAYAPTAHQISNHGITVVVISLEPFRMPISGIGPNYPYIQKMKKEVSKKILKYCGTPIRSWNLGGHSAGGYAAMRILLDCVRKKNKKKNKENDYFQNLILWGAGTMSDLLVDLTLVPFSFSTLVIEASEDPLAKFTKDSRAFLRSKFPIMSSSYNDTNQPPNIMIHELIRGGNHGGFAHYPDSPLDGTRRIPLSDQNKLVAKFTANFLQRQKFI